MNYKEKYQKYKKKYIELKNKLYGGGQPRKLDINLNGMRSIFHLNLAECVGELIEGSYKIYESVLKRSSIDNPTTIVCGGQSPAYYCLAMMNFRIYDPNLVNIIILPHSYQGRHLRHCSQKTIDNESYCNRLKEKNIQLRKNVVIIDGVHSGAGILALQNALYKCYELNSIYKIAINVQKGISKIPVNEEIVLKCETKFSDVFPRLVNQYYPENFNNGTEFITNFINIDHNPFAEMIIDIAKTYPDIAIEDTEWYKLNNIITPELSEAKCKERESVRYYYSR